MTLPSQLRAPPIVTLCLHLQRCIKDETPTPSLKLALSVIRMAAWDSDVFFKFKQVRRGKRSALLGPMIYALQIVMRACVIRPTPPPLIYTMHAIRSVPFCSTPPSPVSVCLRARPAGLQVLIDRTPHANEKQQVDIYRDAVEVSKHQGLRTGIPLLLPPYFRRGYTFALRSRWSSPSPDCGSLLPLANEQGHQL